MAEDEERIREYEEKMQLESLKRKVSSMRYPAPERKKPKMSFSKSLSGLGAGGQGKPEPQDMQVNMQVKIKTMAKAIKLPVLVSAASKSRIEDKPWKFATKNVDECTICSNHLFSVCHPHISSVAERRAAEGETYSCCVCRTTHAKEEAAANRRVTLCSSSLHNIWKESNFNPGFHIDFDCIIGGQIHDIHATFLNQYWTETQPMDVVLACGIDNVPTDDSAADIIFSFKSLVKSIQEQNRDNRLVIATLLYAPKYCDVGVPPSRNMLEKVREVNRWIGDYNRGATGQQLDLGSHGVDGDPAEGVVVHRYSDWREPSIDRKLHFAAGVKATIATQLVEVFKGLDQEGIIC
jgi:hypothetical protein